MKILWGLFPLLLISQVSFAALPPTAESFRRLKAILDSHEVYQALGEVNWITSIKEQSANQYVLESKNCQIQVAVEAVPSAHTPKLIGPLSLKVSVGELTCK